MLKNMRKTLFFYSRLQMIIAKLSLIFIFTNKHFIWNELQTQEGKRGLKM